MVLCDDLSLPLTEQELARRKFLGVVGASALGAAFVGTAVTTLRFLEPNVLFEEDSRVGVGRPEDILPGTVLVLPQQKLYVVRTREGFYALSSVCTHLGCMTRYERAGTEAPPPRPRLAVQGRARSLAPATAVDFPSTARSPKGQRRALFDASRSSSSVASLWSIPASLSPATPS